jgi:hypothetical protein
MSVGQGLRWWLRLEITFFLKEDETLASTSTNAYDPLLKKIIQSLTKFCRTTCKKNFYNSQTREGGHMNELSKYL